MTFTGITSEAQSTPLQFQFSLWTGAILLFPPHFQKGRKKWGQVAKPEQNETLGLLRKVLQLHSSLKAAAEPVDAARAAEPRHSGGNQHSPPTFYLSAPILAGDGHSKAIGPCLGRPTLHPLESLIITPYQKGNFSLHFISYPLPT